MIILHFLLEINTAYLSVTKVLLLLTATFFTEKNSSIYWGPVRVNSANVGKNSTFKAVREQFEIDNLLAEQENVLREFKIIL